MPEVKAPQRSAAWFKSRKGRVTGSMVGAILGVNPWMTPADAMRTMVREYHDAEREFKGNIATEWGTFNEDGATYDYTLETGNEVTECGFFEYEDWLGASPDGLIGDDGVIEIKCPFGIRKDNPPTFKRLEEDLPYYYAQTQIEMLCTGRARGDFYQWAPHGTDLQEFNRDEAWLAKNIPILKAFHADFLKELSNKEHLQPKRPRITKKAAVMLTQEIDDLNDAIDLAKARKEEAMSELVEMAGERDVDIDGRLLTLVKKKGGVKWAQVVKSLRPKGLSDKYLEKHRGKSSEYWRLT